jgi:hypothetical protein
MIYTLDFARDIRASYDVNEHGRELVWLITLAIITFDWVF